MFKKYLKILFPLVIILLLLLVAQLREEATLALDRLERESFSNYLVLLCQELANEGCKPHIRKAAGIGLKNAFTAKVNCLLNNF